MGYIALGKNCVFQTLRHYKSYIFEFFSCSRPLLQPKSVKYPAASTWRNPKRILIKPKYSRLDSIFFYKPLQLNKLNTRFSFVLAPLLVYRPNLGPSTKDVRQMGGGGVVLRFRTFPDGGRGWFVKIPTSENF